MTWKTIIAIALVGLAVGGFILRGGAGNTPAASSTAPQGIKPSDFLSASKSSYAFGAISMRNGNVTTVFRITNSGGEDVTIDSVLTSCMCTAAYVIDGTRRIGPFGMPGHGSNSAGAKVRAGDARDILVVYDPNAHGPAGVGPMQRFVQLVDDRGGVLQLEIKGLVTP